MPKSQSACNGKARKRGQGKRTILLPDDLDLDFKLPNPLFELLEPRARLVEFRLGNLLVEEAVLDLFLKVLES